VFAGDCDNSRGLLSLVISRLGPIRDFGVFLTIGTVLSFFVAIVGFRRCYVCLEYALGTNRMNIRFGGVLPKWYVGIDE
jgi:hypothetical protein